MSDKLSGIDVDITVTPFTTKEKRNDYDITVEFWREAGLDILSVVRCSKIHIINVRHFTRKLGKLEEQDLEHVNDAMRKYLGV